tara:strand:- start:37 stop:153 length:117 start_codon:yes stop_codon:yes gene_type:complete
MVIFWAKIRAKNVNKTSRKVRIKPFAKGKSQESGFKLL